MTTACVCYYGIGHCSYMGLFFGPPLIISYNEVLSELCDQIISAH